MLTYSIKITPAAQQLDKMCDIGVYDAQCIINEAVCDLECFLVDGMPLPDAVCRAQENLLDNDVEGNAAALVLRAAVLHVAGLDGDSIGGADGVECARYDRDEVL
jgi:hypothetical protein